MASEATERIIAVLKGIPYGSAISYGQVAEMAGMPRGARQVVRVLSAMSRAEGLPWWRVVRKDGSIALGESGGGALQRALLESEGVEVGPAGAEGSGGVVDLNRFRAVMRGRE